MRKNWLLVWGGASMKWSEPYSANPYYPYVKS